MTTQAQPHHIAEAKAIPDSLEEMRRAAAAIIAGSRAARAPHRLPDDLPGLLRRRAHREWRVPVRHTPLSLRGGFTETTFTYSEEEARTEAGRCLDCDRFCSICVGVCPNLAILTYASAPMAVDVPSLRIEGGRVVAGPAHRLRVEQRLQVAVLTDFCNECGNCATFCPTAGTPYRDKPRLYLDRVDFEAQQENAFMLLGHGVIEARSAGETHRVAVDGGITCSTPRVSVRLDPMTWEVREARAAPGAADGEVSLQACAAGYALLVSLSAAAPFLPAASAVGGGTFVAHPGYEE